MFRFQLEDSKYQHIHFIGIGGISMSGLAELLYKKGFAVTGSDEKKSPITNHLEDLGIKIFMGHDGSHVVGADLVIYTDAVRLDNPELQKAILSKIDVVDRATFLGEIMREYKTSIAVSGTHGKTTTTSMIASIISDSNKNPTILIGGNLMNIRGNVMVGEENLFLTEACEYRSNVLKYYPTTAIILNIDEDHLDHFDNIDHIVETFQGYVQNIESDGFLILNLDDLHAEDMIKVANCHIITTSMTKPGDYEAKDVRMGESNCYAYTLFHKGVEVGDVHLSVMGLHNVGNSLSAIAACHENGVDLKTCISGVESYTGVDRRLQKKGERNHITVIDDYAHHPTEILSSLNAIKPMVKNRLICIFQPHTFTRTKMLLEGFSKSFQQADVTIITDIYAAREKDYGDIHSKTLTDAICANGGNANYVATPDEVLAYIQEIAEPGDCIVTMGAGDVYKIGETYLK